MNSEMKEQLGRLQSVAAAAVEEVKFVEAAAAARLLKVHNKITLNNL